MRNGLCFLVMGSCLIAVTACQRDSESARTERAQPWKAQARAEADPTAVLVQSVADEASGVELLTAAQHMEKQGILFDELAHGDQRGDWGTEAFHEGVKERLGLITAMVHNDSQDKLAVGRNLLIHDFSSSELRPDDADLSEAWRDRNLQVLRPSIAFEPSTRHRGLNGLTDAIVDLVQPFSNRAGIDIHFKTYRVHLAGTSAQTDMYVDTDGKSADGGIQQNMTWRCEWRQASDGGWRLASLTLVHFEEVRYSGKSEKLFSDSTESVLAHNACFRSQICQVVDHWRLRLEEQLGVDAAALVGMALGDVNGDGLEDVYYCEIGGLPNRLFVQRPDGTVRDTSADAGVDWLDRSRAALFVDWDNDGDQDLTVNVGPVILFMQNDGTGRFKPSARLRPHPAPYSLAAADYDNDGFVDLYVCSYGNNLESFSDTIAPIPYHDANNGAPNTLYRNEANWSFRDVTQQVGLDEHNRRFSFSASWEDFDNDGDLDLFVANDFGRKNLYVNEVRQTGQFRDRAAEYEVEDLGSGMSADWGDYDNDGWMDLWVGNMFSSAGNRIAFQPRFMPGANDEQVSTYRRFARGNSLFRNPATGPFRDVSIDAGVTLGRWAWSSVMADINNDGWLDLLVANGHISGVAPDDL
jgi:hypothetical protein